MRRPAVVLGVLSGLLTLAVVAAAVVFVLYQSRPGAPDASWAAGAGGHYAAVDDLCASADLTALTEVAPGRTAPDHRTTRSGGAGQMYCGITMSGAGLTGLFQARAETFPGDARQTFEERRGEATDQISDVPRVGTAAYSYTNAALGPIVVAYDGNLYLTVGWTALGENATDPPDVIERLVRVARGTMANLRG